ncbi:MAG: hypothetical protein ACQEXJ_15665 [Myxococcota bacterium]
MSARRLIPWMALAALGAGGYFAVVEAQEDAAVPDGAAGDDAGADEPDGDAVGSPPEVRMEPPDGGGGEGFLTGLSPFPVTVDAEIDPGAAADAEAWAARLAAREQALVRTQQALMAQMERVEERERKVEERWREAMEARQFAEEACGAPVVGERPSLTTLPLTEEERETRLERVRKIVKKMGPDEAAAMMQRWSDPLAVNVLEGLSPRVVAPLLAEMPAEEAARLTRRMATGGPERVPRGGGSP